MHKVDQLKVNKDVLISRHNSNETFVLRKV